MEPPRTHLRRDGFVGVSVRIENAMLSDSFYFPSLQIYLTSFTMYFGRKAEPKASKVTFERDRSRAYALHRDRLRSVRPSIDNRPPRQFPHMRRNLKKEQQMEERYAKIEHENRVLLSKMGEIMQKNTLDNVSREYRYGHSLNRVARKRELQRITQENAQILRRIQGTMPMYNHWQWEKERADQERLVANICEYEPSITRGGAAASASTRSLGRRTFAYAAGEKENIGFYVVLSERLADSSPFVVTL